MPVSCRTFKTFTNPPPTPRKRPLSVSPSTFTFPSKSNHVRYPPFRDETRLFRDERFLHRSCLPHVHYAPVYRDRVYGRHGSSVHQHLQGVHCELGRRRGGGVQRAVHVRELRDPPRSHSDVRGILASHLPTACDRNDVREQ